MMHEIIFWVTFVLAVLLASYYFRITTNIIAFIRYKYLISKGVVVHCSTCNKSDKCEDCLKSGFYKHWNRKHEHFN